MSHECDYPAAAAHLPKVTWTNLASNRTGKEIDAAVSGALESGDRLYDLDLELLERLAPDISWAGRQRIEVRYRGLRGN